MATSIPPHNIVELCGAALHLKAPKARVDTLLEHVKGPDFPTAVCVEPASVIREAYATAVAAARASAFRD